MLFVELVRLKCIQRVLNPHLASPLGAAFRQLFADKFTNDCFNPMIQHFICLSSLTLGWDVEASVLVELGVVPGETEVRRQWRIASSTITTPTEYIKAIGGVDSGHSGMRRSAR